MALHISHSDNWLTIAEAAQQLTTGGRPVTEADVLRLVQEGLLQLSVRFLGTIYGECEGVRPPYDEGKNAARLPLTDGEVFELPMIGAASLAVEEARRRYMGQENELLRHTDAMLVDDAMGNRFQLYHRLGDYSPVTRLPDHALLLLRRDELEQLRRDQSEDELPEKPLDTRLRENLYAMIAALCQLGKLDMNPKSGLVAAIEAETMKLGHHVEERTVQTHLSRVRKMFVRG
jgi:hypothetical protein